MSRSKARTFVLIGIAISIAGGLFAACGGGGELGIIRSFFQASRFDDRTTLGNMAMVAFDPAADGVASGLSVESVGEEQRRPLLIRDLADALAQSQAEEEEFTGRKKVYQDENFDAIARVLEAERDQEDVPPRDMEVQTAWTQWRDETMEHAKMVSDAQSALNNESQVAQVSVFDPNNPIDVQEYEGELITKDVVVSATVTRDGAEEERTMTVTMERVVLGEGEDMIDGRWIITGIS